LTIVATNFVCPSFVGLGLGSTLTASGLTTPVVAPVVAAAVSMVVIVAARNTALAFPSRLDSVDSITVSTETQLDSIVNSLVLVIIVHVKHMLEFL